MAALVPRVKTQASQTLTQAHSHPDSQAERERWREESSSGALSPDRVCCGKATERELERERERVTGVTRKRIGGGGEPRREGWTVRVRDRAEESVKLQQPGDKSFSLPLSVSASEG